jgi:uncharacterized RDD family membrane protein YckC
MKCPKCHYLSFEPEPRCRHCGHDLSLADGDLFAQVSTDPPPQLDEIELRRDPAPGPAPTLGLIRPERPAPPLRVRPAVSDPGPVAGTTELPLFVKAIEPSAVPPVSAASAAAPAAAAPVLAPPPPLPAPPRLMAVPPPALEPPVAVPAAPRPLSVRRPAPDSGRQRAANPLARQRVGPIDNDLLEGLERIEIEERRQAALDRAATPAGGASLVSRIAAGGLDVAFLGVLNAIAIILTGRVSGVPMSELPWTTLMPLAAFLWLMDLGYLWLFTVSSGQTIGKMALGLRVVDVSHDRPRTHVTIRQATYRALLTFPSVMALGAGFLPALVGRGGALHDRLSQTRVIRA